MSKTIAEQKRREPYITDPLRHPKAASPKLRTKRAWWLIALTLFLPGSAQLVAGDKKLGRKILCVTFSFFAVLLLLVIMLIVRRQLVLNLFLSPISSIVIVIILLALAVGWLLVFLNTFKLINVSLLKKSIRPFVTIGLIAAIFITSGPLAYGAYMLGVGQGALGHIFSDGIDVEPSDGRYNFLLLGGDAGEDRQGRRPDSISVVSIDANTGQAVTIAIPRNTQNAPFPSDSPMHEVYPEGYNCGDECIINSLYPTVNEKYQDHYPRAKDPGAQATKEAASAMLGIDIQAYVLVDMDGFEKLIDAMGGITIDAGGWVPISGANIEGTDKHEPPVGWIHPGKQKMNGNTALWYGRSREYATDYSRIQRQQCVQQAMLKQLDPATVLTRFQEIAASGEEIFESDISSRQLSSFVDLAVKSRSHEMKRLTIGPPDFGTVADNFNTYPDWDRVHSKVQEVLNSSDDSNTKSAPKQNNIFNVSLVSFTPSKNVNHPKEENNEITEEYLQKLAVDGQTDKLQELLKDNGKCSI